MGKEPTALIKTRVRPAPLRPAPLAAQKTTPMQLLAIAVAKDADIDKLAKLMDLQERWEAREAEKEFVIALSAFKQSPTKLKKTKKAHVTPRSGGTGFDYWYSPLGEVSAAISADLAKHGLSFRWSVEQIEQSIAVTCILQHEAGHRERTTLKGLPDDSGAKNPIQQIGSTVTYLQRYTLLAAVGLAPQDDGDGRVIEAGTGKESRTKAAAQAGTDKVFEGIIMETGTGSARAFGGDYKWVLLNNVAEKLFSFKAAHWPMLLADRRVRLTALEMQAQTKAFWNITEVVQVDTLDEPPATILSRMFPDAKHTKTRRLVMELLKDVQPYSLHSKVLTAFEKRMKAEQPSTETGMMAELDIAKQQVLEEAAMQKSEEGGLFDEPQ